MFHRRNLLKTMLGAFTVPFVFRGRRSEVRKMLETDTDPEILNEAYVGNDETNYLWIKDYRLAFTDADQKELLQERHKELQGRVPVSHRTVSVSEEEWNKAKSYVPSTLWWEPFRPIELKVRGPINYYEPLSELPDNEVCPCRFDYHDGTSLTFLAHLHTFSCEWSVSSNWRQTAGPMPKDGGIGGGVEILKMVNAIDGYMNTLKRYMTLEGMETKMTGYAYVKLLPINVSCQTIS